MAWTGGQFRTSFLLVVLALSFFGESLSAQTRQEPRHCLESKRIDIQCSVHVVERYHSIETASYVLWALPGATYQKKPNGEVQWIRGIGKIRAKRKMTVTTLYGEVHWSEGEVYLHGRDAIVVVTNLSSDMIYQARGDKKWNSLPPGYSNYFTRVNKSGMAEVGFPRSAEIEPLLESWAQFQPRSQIKSWQAEVKDFLKAWKKATELTGPWYLEITKREIASIQSEEARQRELRERREREDQAFRRLFRERYFLQ